MKGRVLVVDDEASVRYALRSLLEDEGIEVVEARNGEEALAVLDAQRFDLVLTDLRMPRIDGLELVRRVRDRSEPPRVVLITAHGSERHAIEALRAGAYDYFPKPFENDAVLASVSRALEAATLARENERLTGEAMLAQSLVFASPAMSRVATVVHRVASRDVAVLILGESGTGKERIAEAIVRASPRAAKPYVRFNCASLTPELAAAELFGHARGAFTGAHRARTGLFREADGGTLLLDEVGDLDLATQAKLLRVLQEREVRAVGEDRPARVDVRVLAATHRDLESRVREGLFREDLFYRLKVVTVVVPPLRERREDIAPLARHFIERASRRFGIECVRSPPELFARLESLPWRGNVRELENAIESLVALSGDDGALDLDLIPKVADASAGDAAVTLREKVDAYERGLIVAALEQSRGNRSEAARLLGVPRATLHEKMQKHRLG